MNRRELVGAAAAVTAVSSWPGLRAAMAAPRPRFRNSLCASPFAEGVFARNITFRAGDHLAANVRELQQLFMAFGSTELFVRLGSRTAGAPGESMGMSAARERARLARSLGIPLNPELLLCARYGDESGQPEPDFSDYPEIRLRKPWHELGIEEMCDAVRLYGELAARQILETGVTVGVWDIGNEVDCGIAGVALPPMVPTIGGKGWTYRAPDAVDPEIGKMTVARFFGMPAAEQADWGRQHLFGHIGSILAAMAEGIRKIEPRARVMTHLGGLAVQRPEVLVAFFEAVEAKGFRSEALGTSFYPTAYPFFLPKAELTTDRFTVYKRTAELAKARLGKPLYIAEWGYAAGPMAYGGFNWDNPVPGYPISPQGQGDFLRNLVAWGVRTGTLAGIRPWAPDFVGSGWQSMALFDAPVNGQSTARPALGAIAEGLRQAAHPTH